MGLWDMDWIHVTQDSGKRQTVVNMVMNLTGSVKGKYTLWSCLLKRSGN
jgi:hypothetical protein